ncbi:Vacuolar acid trehalase [Olea europaea subsp. europaea]|uniref:Vacuolar acid trehalase n=1 Tax=Olea europaea subsp. europaea TaxID=158383 RepID=A0A8S0UMA1_OLEEU|nr:Vacuolar acid trehalase [Olea europaea subsp. europaea]
MLSCGCEVKRRDNWAWWGEIAKSLPRMCFLSGLTGEEMMVFIDSFPESGLEPPAFAALVPNSADKPLAELIEEIMLDHEMLVSP